MNKIKQNKGFLLFSGYNLRAIIAFCRELTNYDIPFFIIAADINDLIYSSAYSSKVFIYRKSKRLIWEEINSIIKYLLQESGIEHLVIAPTSEFLNQFLLENRANFEKINCSVPLVPMELYQLITNKYSFSELCVENGIKIPVKYKPLEELRFPCVAKPQKNIGNEHKTLYPYLIYTEKEYRRFLEKEKPDEYYFEEYIEGDSYYLLMYLSQNGGTIKYSQKNILQQADGKSIVLALPAEIHLDSKFEIFETMLRKHAFYGIIMIEVRLNNNNVVVIEANPRLWGPSQLFVDNSIGIFSQFINDTIGIDNDIIREQKKTFSKKNYLWFNGIVEMLLKRKQVIKLCAKTTWLPFLAIANLGNDVYLRSDTIYVFFKELFGLIKKELIHGKG